MDALESLLSTPETVVPVLVFGIVLVVLGLSGNKRRRWRPRTGGSRPFRLAGSGDGRGQSVEAVEQLAAVMAATFTTKRVLSRSEQHVMDAAERAITDLGLSWRVLAQVALGEVLASADEDGFRAINAKRVDMLVVTRNSVPVAAIEYQGEGHYQGTAPARDAVKKEALRKAGVDYVEIKPGDGPDDVHRIMARLAHERGLKTLTASVQEPLGPQRSAAQAA